MSNIEAARLKLRSDPQYRIVFRKAQRNFILYRRSTEFAPKIVPESLLVANPINRYLLNSPMLPQFVKEADGCLTFLVQNDSPGKDKEANWLPAPKGPFIMVMRLYWPKDEALEGKWTAPALQRVE